MVSFPNEILNMVSLTFIRETQVSAGLNPKILIKLKTFECASVGKQMAVKTDSYINDFCLRSTHQNCEQICSFVTWAFFSNKFIFFFHFKRGMEKKVVFF